VGSGEKSKAFQAMASLAIAHSRNYPIALLRVQLPLHLHTLGKIRPSARHTIVWMAAPRGIVQYWML